MPSDIQILQNVNLIDGINLRYEILKEKIKNFRHEDLNENIKVMKIRFFLKIFKINSIFF